MGQEERQEKKEKAEEGKGAQGKSQEKGLDFLLNIPLDVTVELGRTRMNIGDLLNLDKGAVIELDKEASEPLDILVNDQPVAKGEVVVMEKRFGIRITDIITPAERVERLK